MPTATSCSSDRVLVNCWQMWTTTTIVWRSVRHEYFLVDSRGRAVPPHQRSGRKSCPLQQPPDNGIFMINAANRDQISFEDERLAQFESNTDYYSRPRGLQDSGLPW